MEEEEKIGREQPGREGVNREQKEGSSTDKEFTDNSEESEKETIPAENTPFSLSYIERYSRQMIIKEIGKEGQNRIKTASVLVVGAGGLGAPSLLYLAAMGIGRIGLSDSDTVEDSNLNRQVLYSELSVGQMKTSEAVKVLKGLSSGTIYTEHGKISKGNIWEIGENYDLVLDCGDSRSLRYLLSYYCRTRQIPYIGGSSLRWEGHVYVLNRLCYGCIHPSVTPYLSGNCASAGIIGSLCGIVGSQMATEALKTVLGIGGEDRMFYTNSLTGESMNISLRRKKCRICRESPNLTDTQRKLLISEEIGRIEEMDEIGITCPLDRVEKEGISYPLDQVDGVEENISEVSASISEISTKIDIPNKEMYLLNRKSEISEKIRSIRIDSRVKPPCPPSEIDWKSVLSYSSLYLIVDIRIPAENRILPIPGAYLYTLSDIVDHPKRASEVIRKKAHGRQIALFCRNGSTSKKFLNIFNALNITGGAQAYIAYSKQ